VTPASRALTQYLGGTLRARARWWWAYAVAVIGVLATPVAAQTVGKFDLNCSISDQVHMLYRVDLDNRRWSESSFDRETEAVGTDWTNGHFLENLGHFEITSGYIQGDWLLFSNFVHESTVDEVGANLRTMAYVKKTTRYPSGEIVTQIGRCERLPFSGA
jgi:hypothetical protein